MKIACIYRKDSGNVGDNNCCPADYFPIDAERYDIEEEPRHASILLFGGGGLLYNEGAIQNWLDFNPKSLVIGWGIGLNGQCVVPAWMDRFHLLGMRDYRPARDCQREIVWVPCVSCMSPLLDWAPPIGWPEVEQWAVYEHRHRPIATPGRIAWGVGHRDLPANAPKINNFVESMEEAVGFLKSHTHIATNSYHGWYWSMLLGKRVALTEKWRTSFINRLYDSGGGYSYPDVLQCHRKATESFWRRVKDALHNQPG